MARKQPEKQSKKSAAPTKQAVQARRSRIAAMAATEQDEDRKEELLSLVSQLDAKIEVM